MPRFSSRLEPQPQPVVCQPSVEPTRRAEGWAIARFLLVCADEVWGRRARDVLRGEGFDVEMRLDGTNVLAQIVSHRPDVVGIDLALPDSFGVTLCSSVRSRTAVAIFAVGPRASEASILAALGNGADTVIPKEAPPRELVARVRSLLRRFPPRPPAREAVLTCGTVQFDQARRRATVSGMPVDLDDVSLDLLEALLRNPGRVVPRAELRRICGADSDGRGALELHVRRLRETLETGAKERWIQAVRGVGFRFEAGRTP